MRTFSSSSPEKEIFVFNAESTDFFREFVLWFTGLLKKIFKVKKDNR